MLAAIGEAPISQSELDTPARSDVDIAVDVMRNIIVETQAEGWRFNVEWGYEIAPTDDSPYTHTFRDSTTNAINVFAPPSDMIAFKLSNISAQQGTKYKELVVRDPVNYSGSASSVFYCTADQTDGLDEDEYPFLYVDYIRYVDFDQCPEVFRQYVARAAARRFCQVTVGDPDLSGFTQRDERVAWRRLKREQGEKDRYNHFNNLGTFRHLGRFRVYRPEGVYDDRDSMGV